MDSVSLLATASALPVTDGGVPDWVMVFPAGTSKGVDGRGPYTLDAAKVATASMKPGRDLPFDYNHQTVFAVLNGGPSPASGWIDKLEPRDGALWAHVAWTDPGRAAIAAKEYRFVSPTFTHDKDGNVLTLASAALVNAPNLADLPAIHSRLPQSGDTMDKDEALAAVTAALGLPADTPLDKIATAAADLAAKAETATAAQAAPAAPAAQPDPSQFVPMAAFRDLQATVGNLVTADAKARAEGAVETASREGKVTPAMKEWALTYAVKDPAGFLDWAAKAPVIVAPGARMVPGAPPADAGHGEDDAAVTAVCANLGISVEAYRKAKGGAA